MRLQNKQHKASGELKNAVKSLWLDTIESNGKAVIAAAVYGYLNSIGGILIGRSSTGISTLRLC